MGIDQTKPAIIYCLIDPMSTGYARFRYVGKTERDAACRLSGHLYEARKGRETHCHRWIRTLLRAGTVPTMTILEISDRVSWAERERAWIVRLRSMGCPLTNITDGGEGVSGHRHSPETRAKLSASHAGIKHRNFGKRLPAETRAKISAAHMGKTHSPETRAKLSAANMGHKHNLGRRASADTCAKISASKSGSHHPNFGRHLSKETRQKIAEAAKGRAMPPGLADKLRSINMGNQYRVGSKASEETRAQLSVSLKGNQSATGHHLSADARARISRAHAGKSLSPACRAKISAAAKNQWARQKALHPTGRLMPEANL